MNLPQINTQAELKQFMNHLEANNFGYNGNEIDKFIKTRINKIIGKANVLNVDYDHRQLEKEYEKINSFIEIEEKANAYFGQFDVNTKIKQLVSNISLVPVEPKNGDAILFTEMHPDHKNYSNKYYYDLSKDSMKLWLPQHRHNDVEKLLKLVYGADVDFGYWSEYTPPTKFTFGQWQTANNSLQWRIFKNESIEIKHPEIKKLKDLYLAYCLTFKNRAIKI